jgi:hypothetical protein
MLLNFVAFCWLDDLLMRFHVFFAFMIFPYEIVCLLLHILVQIYVSNHQNGMLVSCFLF